MGAVDLEPSGPGWDYPVEDDEDELDTDDEPDYERMAEDREDARTDRLIGKLMREGLW